MCSRSCDLLVKKGLHTERGLLLLPETFKRSGPLEVCIGIDASGVSLRLEPTTFNCI